MTMTNTATAAAIAAHQTIRSPFAAGEYDAFVDRSRPRASTGHEPWLPLASFRTRRSDDPRVSAALGSSPSAKPRPCTLAGAGPGSGAVVAHLLWGQAVAGSNP